MTMKHALKEFGQILALLLDLWRWLPDYLLTVYMHIPLERKALLAATYYDMASTRIQVCLTIPYDITLGALSNESPNFK